MTMTLNCRILCAVALTLAACSSVQMYTTGSSVILDESVTYEPTQAVELLTETPSRPYHTIAIVEAIGMPAAGTPALMERLRLEARNIGANAVIPSESETRESPQNLTYNPWLGGYQTSGGVQSTILRGLAIRYDDAIP